MTTRLSRGISTEMFFRLCTRVPCTAIVVRTPLVPTACAGRMSALLAIDPTWHEERELLQRRRAALGGANRRGRLDDQVAIGEIFAGRRDALDSEVAREVVLDVARRSDLAGIAKVVEHGREQPCRTLCHIRVSGPERVLHGLPGFLCVQQIRIDDAEELLVEGERLWNDFAIDQLACRDDLDLRERSRGVQDPERCVLEVAARDEKLARLVKVRQHVSTGAEQRQRRIALADALEPRAQI